MQRIFKEEDIRSIEECYLLGYLAIEEKVFPSIGEDQSCITYLRKNPQYILFYIKAMSSIPKNLYDIPGPFENNMFVGFEKGIEGIGMPLEYWDLEIKEKKEYIYEKLKNKLVLFTPYLKKEEKLGKVEIYYRNLVVRDVEDLNNYRGHTFVPIPSPIVRGFEEFERAIMRQDPIRFENYSKYMDDPEFIICDDYIYYNLNWGRTLDDKRMLQGIGEIKKIEIPDHFRKNIVYKVNDNLLFLTKEYIDGELKEYFKNGEHVLKNSEEKLDYKIIKSEYEFLKRFKYNLTNTGLFYKEEDIYNFHISLKTNPLTIISGMSGIGKTSLAISYAKALGLEDKNYIVVPISPSYTEPSDIIGYLNTSKDEYIPSETGVVDLLRTAQENTDEVFMIIFDEMNLSQVEYWFSPFISILEMEKEERNLILYNKNSKCKNSSDYPASIKIGKNVVFVGTVNIDETTKEFSDRLLDRANLINPKKISFIEMKNILESYRGKTLENLDEKYYLNFKFWRRDCTSPLDIFRENELKLLDDIHNAINAIDRQKGISYRTLYNMASYIFNIPETEKGELLLSREKSFDIQIKQRILTKVKGHQEQYGKLIGNIEKGHINHGEIYKILIEENYKGISDFKISIDELKRKAEEMYYNGYTL
ncbi:McrB family protein [Clostridium cylindrosporum]|uniref:GTPase subunit of restriction endonuclease n=1 Tax=Clostridium cylindrosporum DSM 605 TaxID=1121307 RepID=A0A0J8DAS3_CLOCY|nr:AAA family ATPase [Clostridium cylindrosporum]KMT23145.1 GTPase subunit of restriction endonuclease [Clostridium cylindrosporum DSM 605]